MIDVQTGSPTRRTSNIDQYVIVSCVQSQFGFQAHSYDCQDVAFAHQDMDERDRRAQLHVVLTDPLPSNVETIRMFSKLSSTKSCDIRTPRLRLQLRSTYQLNIPAGQIMESLQMRIISPSISYISMSYDDDETVGGDVRRYSYDTINHHASIRASKAYQSIVAITVGF